VAATDPNVIYVGCLGGNFGRSTDGGLSFGWPGTVPSSPVEVLAERPGASGATFYAGTQGGVYKSTDGGASWGQPALQFDVKDLVVDPQHPDNIWVAASDANGLDHVYASFDNAVSWAEMSEGLPAGARTNGLCLKAGATPQAPCSLYIATSVGVYRRELSFLASRNPDATAPNSSRKLVREPDTQKFHLVYTSTDSIFYSHSEDGGQTWATAEFIDRGFAPAIVLNPLQGVTGYAPWVAYVRNNNTVWRAIRFAPSVWDYALVFAGSAATQVGGLALASASLSMLDPMAYVTYPVTDPGSPPQHRINFNTFSRIWVSPPEIVHNSGSADSRDPSIAVTPGDIIHVCWNMVQGARQSIVYKVKQYGMPWLGPYDVSGPFPPASEPASHPSVEAYGDKVYCVWRGPNSGGSMPGDIWRSWSLVTPTIWTTPENQCGIGSASFESDNPEISTNFVTLWNEEVPDPPGNSDILAKYDWPEDPRTVYASPLPSRFPHVVGYWEDPVNPDLFHTNTVWTEQVAQNPPLYEVKFTDYDWQPPFDLPSSDIGTYYNADLGQPERSPYCTARDSYVTYQSCSTDFGRNRLSYQLPYLSPRYDYLLSAVFYHEGSDTSGFEVKADSGSPLNRLCRSYVPETVWVSVPEPAYQRTAKVNLGVRRTLGKGVWLSDLRLFQLEPSDPRGGGKDALAQDRSDLPILVLGQNSPNPFRTATAIRFQLPGPGNVSIRVMDVTGRLVRELVNGKQQAGEHAVLWDGKDNLGRTVAPGVYFYRLRTTSGSETRRAVLVR
jgi:hypothetical protein